MRNRQNRVESRIGMRVHRTILTWIMSITLCAGTFTVVSAQVEPVFLYSLSNFDGPVPSNWAALCVDKEKNEIYVVDTRERDIRVFDDKGMEIYRFGDDGSLGYFIDVAVKDGGNILVLSREQSKPAIVECNFRGEPISRFEPTNLPPGFSGFSPNHITYQKGKIFLVDSVALRIAVMDDKGLFQQGYDLVSLLKIEEKKRGDSEIGGFSVDQDGNMLFTIPVFFSAYKLPPDGKLLAFGKPGGAPGGFGVVGGITADEAGNLYVADLLKSVVLIFDKNFNFVKEFGYRGFRPGNLIGPKNLALAPDGRLYVSQIRSRGVSVFKITRE